MEYWVVGNCWSFGVLRFLVLECWSAGMLECWSVGEFDYWSVGMLGC